MSLLSRKLKYLIGIYLIAASSFTLAENVELNWQRDRTASIKKGDGSDFSVTQVGVKSELFEFNTNDELVSFGVNVQRTDFQWEDSGLLSDNYYWFGLPVHYRQQRSQSTEFVARLEPGLMSTRDNLKKDSFYVNGELGARFYRNAHTYSQIGVMVDRSFGDARAYPMAMVAFKPDRITEVKLGFPYSSIQANWSKTFSTYAQVKPAGGLWLAAKESGLGANTDIDVDAGGDTNDNAGDVDDVEDIPPVIDDEEDDGGAITPDDDDTSLEGTATGKPSKKVKYRNWQAALGSSFYWREGVWLKAEVGYSFAREIQAAGKSATPENSLFWQLGLKVEF